MERILTRQQSDDVVNCLPKFWTALYPDWSRVKTRLVHVYSIPKDEVEQIATTMDNLMAEWGFRLPRSTDPDVDKYEGIVFVDEDAYQWFLQNWK